MDKDLFKKLSEVIKAQNELLYALKNELIDSNGHDYVDLGLPSGTLWATCNVGASKPTDYGSYFQWGDTQGYKDSLVGKIKRFSWDDYKLYKTNKSGLKKYKDLGATLDLEDDAAHAKMGGDWHIPTPEQIKELLNNTDNHWITLDGTNGYIFKSKKDKNKSIFIPAAGFAMGGSVYVCESNGYIWSSMLSIDSAYSAQFLYFYFGLEKLCSGYSCCDRFSVRGVIG